MSNTARSGASVTPHDTNANEFDALWIGVSGNLAVKLSGNNNSITFENVPIGWFPVKTSLVLSTGTTASSIIGVRW
jgi:hypothetical protein